jgi:hypothetical protein
MLSQLDRWVYQRLQMKARMACLRQFSAHAFLRERRLIKLLANGITLADLVLAHGEMVGFDHGRR